MLLAQVEKTIEQATRDGRRGDENKARLAKTRQKKLSDRWGVEQSAKGGRFKVGFSTAVSDVPS